MTKMAAMAINSKTFKILQNQKAYDFETLHEASGRTAQESFVNYGPGMTLIYFTAMSTWLAYAFEWLPFNC